MQSAESLHVYDRPTRWLHWGSAVLLVGIFLLGWGAHWVPRGEPRMMVRSVHITLGVVLTLLLLLRIEWRRRQGVHLEPLASGWRQSAARLFHVLLYVAMIVMVSSGIVAVWFRGVNLFDWMTIPAFDPSNKPMRRLLVDIHEVIAYGLMGLAGLHVLFALWHQYRLKDGIMHRMWPPLRQGGPSA